MTGTREVEAVCTRPKAAKAPGTDSPEAPTRIRRAGRWLPVMGWGACCVSGCPCRAFKQTYGSELCNNCGHNYTDHS